MIDAEISKVETKISGIALGETAAIWQCQFDDPLEISDFLALFPGNLLASVSGFRQTLLSTFNRSVLCGDAWRLERLQATGRLPEFNLESTRPTYAIWAWAHALSFQS